MKNNNWIIIDPTFSPEVLKDSGKDIIKERANRIVFKSGPFLIKGFRIKFFRFKSPAFKEWELSEKLGELSPPRVAVGRHKNWEYIVFRFLKNARNLEDFFYNCWPYLHFKEKLAFFKALADFLASFFNKNVFQPDFHLKNILVCTSPWRFFLIDLHRAKSLKFEDSEKYIAEQFAYILPPFLEYLTWWEIGRITVFLKEKMAILFNRSFRLKIQRKSYDLMRNHWQKHKIHISPYRTNGFKIWCKKPVYLDLVKSLATKKGLLKEINILKSSRITKTGIIAYCKKKFFVKIYTNPNFQRTMLNLIRQGRAERNFYLSLELNRRSIPSLIPLGAWKKCSFSKISEGLVYPLQQNNLLSHKIFNLLQKKENKTLEMILYRLTKFLWEMHERGIFHGDFKVNNLFVEGKKFIIFDLDAAKIYKKGVPLNKRLKDLATLAFSLECIGIPGHLASRILNFYHQFYSFENLQKTQYIFNTLIQQKKEKRINKFEGCFRQYHR